MRTRAHAPAPAASPTPHPRVQRATSILTVGTLLLGLFVASVGAQERPAGGQVITIGESNSREQREFLLDLFEADQRRDQIVVITVADTNTAMRGITNQSYTSAFSSTSLNCRDLGEGLDVTTVNIDTYGGVTPALYALALVTAGIGDATLVVGAPPGTASIGLTALTGVFSTWDLNPCVSGRTNPPRQRIALEQLALTWEIGNAINSVPAATSVVLESQRLIVINDVKLQTDIDQVIAAQEAAQGVQIPTAQRDRLVNLFVRLVQLQIDWSTFAKGWTIETSGDNTRIIMRGDGIAILHAQQTATAEAAMSLTATAEAEAALTATAEARNDRGADMTATAEAAAAMTATAEAQGTADAISAMTATAAAQATNEALATQEAIAALTATAAARPTSTPLPDQVTGMILSNDASGLTIRLGEGQESLFVVPRDTPVMVDGKRVALETLGSGDRVEMLLRGGSNEVLRMSVTPRPPEPAQSSPLALIVPVALLALFGGGAGFWFLSRRQQPDPFIVKRIAIGAS